MTVPKTFGQLTALTALNLALTQVVSIPENCTHLNTASHFK